MLQVLQSALAASYDVTQTRDAAWGWGWGLRADAVQIYNVRTVLRKRHSSCHASRS